MSGGHFGYKQHQVDDIALEIGELILTNDSTELDEYKCVIGRHYSKETIAKFKEAKETLRKAAIMAQRIDWLVSCDDGEDSFHTRWDEELNKVCK